MSRVTIIVLVALVATIAGFVIASTADLGSDGASTEATVAAGPQTAKLGWRETYGSPGEQLVFTVDWLKVTDTGWSARIGIENRTKVAWKLSPGLLPDGAFGVALFKTGEAKELDERNRAGTLPAVRAATSFRPALDKFLEPKGVWNGVMSASGALVAGSWARVVFGTLEVDGNAPATLPNPIVWITDSAYRLHR